ncbi:MAG TPA: ATP-binding cassette domain-containing protein, partial [Candidatus Bathyarchaeia archaeon]|nr:ATP-binding cassette domain-containing protein [Candidatus Bathyarchaeia archaeon]
MNHLLECKALGLDYPVNDGVLRLYGEGISFALEEGSFVSIVGGSGWGKSTLVNLVLGFERPSR